MITGVNLKAAMCAVHSTCVLMAKAVGFRQGCFVRLQRHWHRIAPNLIKLGNGMTVPHIRLTGSNEGVNKQKRCTYAKNVSLKMQRCARQHLECWSNDDDATQVSFYIFKKESLREQHPYFCNYFLFSNISLKRI